MNYDRVIFIANAGHFISTGIISFAIFVMYTQSICMRLFQLIKSLFFLPVFQVFWYLVELLDFRAHLLASLSMF